MSDRKPSTAPSAARIGDLAGESRSARAYCYALYEDSEEACRFGIEDSRQPMRMLCNATYALPGVAHDAGPMRRELTSFS
jgi:hypothetical protein